MLLVEAMSARPYNDVKYFSKGGKCIMFKDNLISLRKMHSLSQEELAEKIGVSRQTLSKYETGESVPDIEKCRVIADVFEVSLDDLVNFEPEYEGLAAPPKGKYIFGVVKIGEKGQIVIPAKARKIFNLSPGDHLVVLGDETQGLALVKEKGFMSMINEVGAIIKRQKERS